MSVTRHHLGPAPLKMNGGNPFPDRQALASGGPWPRLYLISCRRSQRGSQNQTTKHSQDLCSSFNPRFRGRRYSGQDPPSLPQAVRPAVRSATLSRKSPEGTEKQEDVNTQGEESQSHIQTWTQISQGRCQVGDVGCSTPCKLALARMLPNAQCFSLGLVGILPFSSPMGNPVPVQISDLNPRATQRSEPLRHQPLREGKASKAQSHLQGSYVSGLGSASGSTLSKPCPEATSPETHHHWVQKATAVTWTEPSGSLQAPNQLHGEEHPSR